MIRGLSLFVLTLLVANTAWSQTYPAWQPPHPHGAGTETLTQNQNHWSWWNQTPGGGPAAAGPSFPAPPPTPQVPAYESGGFHLPPPTGWTAAEFASTPLDSQSAVFGPSAEPPLAVLRGHKDGFFQKLAFTTTWIDKGSSGLGITDLQWYATFAVPAPTRDWPLLISPTFQLHLFDGPTAPDLPAQVYDAQLEFLWLPRINDSWQAVLAVTPGIYSDFTDYDSDAFRLTGKALLRYQWVPNHWELLFGGLYVNRGDVTWLPAGGIVWIPAEDIRYEFLFPRPKLAHRIAADGVTEDWVYLAGEFGGDTWSIERTSGARDEITLRDYRLLVGLERKRDGGGFVRLEVGYVFGRAVEYASGTPDFEPDDAVLFRGGFAY